MDSVFFSSSYRFINFYFNKYHCTDNRQGSPFHFLAYMEEGRCKIVSDKGTLSLEAGDLFYIPKTLPYQSFWYGAPEVRHVSLGFLHFPAEESRHFLLQKLPCSPSMRRQMLSIKTGTAPDSQTLSDFYALLAEILPEMQWVSAGKDEAIVEQAKAYMAKNPDCTMPEVAEACFISEPYLYTLFKRIQGETPNTYRQKLLCRKGEELLVSTDKTIEEISSMLKFSSASYFRKTLKKYTGQTPREIRKTGTM